jgi:hypothetical protein
MKGKKCGESVCRMNIECGLEKVADLDENDILY